MITFNSICNYFLGCSWCMVRLGLCVVSWRMYGSCCWCHRYWSFLDDWSQIWYMLSGILVQQGTMLLVQWWDNIWPGQLLSGNIFKILCLLQKVWFLLIHWKSAVITVADLASSVWWVTWRCWSIYHQLSVLYCLGSCLCCSLGFPSADVCSLRLWLW